MERRLPKKTGQEAVARYMMFRLDPNLDSVPGIDEKAISALKQRDFVSQFQLLAKILETCGDPVDFPAVRAGFRTFMRGVVRDRVEARKVADLVLEKILRIFPELDEDVED